jgi:hypothetical protein
MGQREDVYPFVIDTRFLKVWIWSHRLVQVIQHLLAIVSKTSAIVPVYTEYYYMLLKI